LADAFIREGLSPQKVRKAIEYGSEIILSDYPFASARFRTTARRSFFMSFAREKTIG